VSSFLGHVGFYQWFIKDFSKIAKPLTHLLVKDVPFEFNEECLSAFPRLKEALMSAPVTQAPDWELPFEAMLMQVIIQLELYWAKGSTTSHMPYNIQVEHLMKLK